MLAGFANGLPITMAKGGHPKNIQLLCRIKLSSELQAYKNMKNRTRNQKYKISIILFSLIFIYACLALNVCTYKDIHFARLES